MKIIETNSTKFRQMMTLFTQTKQIGHRHTACFNVSNGRTESTKELTEAEVDVIIKELKKLQTDKPKYTPKEGDKQRKKIIGIARDMRWDARGDAIMMHRIDEFMLNRTKYRKKLNDLTVDELNKVCFIFENEVKSSFLKGLNQ